MTTQPRAPVTHDVKCWPEAFDARAAGLKPWEFRFNDRDYRVGDTLRQRRWSPLLQDYTGETDEHLITWALYGPAFGLPAGFVIMSLATATSDAEQALKAALEPFAEQAKAYGPEDTDHLHDWPTFTVGDFRRAARAYYGGDA